MSSSKKHTDATEAEVKEGKVVETKKPPGEKQSDDNVKIKRGRVDSLSIYEVSDSELTTLERGSTNSIFLNFSIFLLSIAISFLIALLTANFQDKAVIQTIFIVLTVVGFLGGSFLLLFWYRKRDDFKITIQKIRERMEE